MGVDHEFNITPCDRILVFIGTYMILSINLIRIVIGISIYTHAGNLIIMSMGKYGPICLNHLFKVMLKTLLILITSHRFNSHCD